MLEETRQYGSALIFNLSSMVDGIIKECSDQLTGTRLRRLRAWITEQAEYLAQAPIEQPPDPADEAEERSFIKAALTGICANPESGPDGVARTALKVGRAAYSMAKNDPYKSCTP